MNKKPTTSLMIPHQTQEPPPYQNKQDQRAVEALFGSDTTPNANTQHAPVPREFSPHLATHPKEERANTSLQRVLPSSIPSFTGTTTFEAMRYETPFLIRVFRSFRRNNLMLMAGGVAYSTLLSIIPLSALLFLTLTFFFDEQFVIQSLSSHLQFLVPGNSDLLTKQLKYFLEHRKFFGGLNIVILLFFSSMAFTMMENAMSVIYAYDKERAKRRFWVSATLPYLYIGLILMGVIGLTVLATMFQSTSGQPVDVMGLSITSKSTAGVLLHIFGLLGLSFLLGAIYIIMPKCSISFRRAMIGGLVAALLWEAMRRILVWFFNNISPVYDLYGPLAVIIVALVMLEMGSLIILIGAQVIAEMERHKTFQRMIAPTANSHIQIQSQ